MKLYLVLVVLFYLAANCHGQELKDIDETIKDGVKKVETFVECASYLTCDQCTKNAKCLWCSSSVVNCIPYPVDSIIPSKDVCDLGDARWGVCWVNYRTLLIVMGCVGGMILLSITGCICCCCCCRRKPVQARNFPEEERLERERQERSLRHAEKRAERNSRVEEIRQKYGLVKDSEPVYQRFENEA